MPRAIQGLPVCLRGGRALCFCFTFALSPAPARARANAHVRAACLAVAVSCNTELSRHPQGLLRIRHWCGMSRESNVKVGPTFQAGSRQGQGRLFHAECPRQTVSWIRSSLDPQCIDPGHCPGPLTSTIRADTLILPVYQILAIRMSPPCFPIAMLRCLLVPFFCPPVRRAQGPQTILRTSRREANSS